jgi:hypothetical protein
MSVYLRIAPGLKVRIGRPRWLRFWAGAGGRGVSTGAGPVSMYRPLRRRRRRR